jgi:FkbM family methyltransferase
MESNKYYTQNDEERIIVDYFGNYKGVVVDIGANDGRTFSNSLRLIELGWRAYLVEPHFEAYLKSVAEHEDNDDVKCFNLGIGPSTQEVPFLIGSDSLLSTTHHEYKHIFKYCEFSEGVMQQMTWRHFYDMIDKPVIDFLSVDAEGMDWDIIQQIDLTEVKMVCFEKNPKKHLIMAHCMDYQLHKIHETSENVIMVKW